MMRQALTATSRLARRVKLGEIEKMVQVFKTHRFALDFDSKFIKN
jgi:hypothetical protein